MRECEGGGVFCEQGRRPYNINIPVLHQVLYTFSSELRYLEEYVQHQHARKKKKITSNQICGEHKKQLKFKQR